ncbi:MULTISPECIES: HEAT repeat domain-containing protein [unclassified Sphingomonas]|uniref:HEAT repeat domain-containing protein n=1 Tax=unclassified Sphingomonas TaxID=196159 RepID=UPI00226986F9|nr:MULTISPECIES: HEAT repeat domain-containing protein [unclassified Sphingomonas]
MNDSIMQFGNWADRIIGAGETSFDGFAKIADVFDEAVSTGAYVASLHDLVGRMASGATDITPNVSSGPFVVLYSSRVTTWAILLHRNINAGLYLNPTHSISAPVAGHSVDSVLYETDRKVDFSVLDPATRLVQKQVKLHQTAEHLLKDGRSQALDVQPTGFGPAFTLRANSAAFGAFEWSFDRNTRLPKRVTSISNVHSNIESIFDLLAAVGSSSSVDVVEPFLTHGAHHVRWKAVQTVGRLAPERRRTMVRNALNDRHPHIRQAAAATLEQLPQ